MIELQHLDMESSQPTLADCVASPELVYDTYSAEAVSLAFSVYCGTPATPRMLPKEGFLAAWRAQESNDRTKGSRRAWLLSIVRNRAIDLLRATSTPRVTAQGQLRHGGQGGCGWRGGRSR